MARIKVKLQDTTPARVVFLDPDATDGANFDRNLFMADGSLATPASVRTWLGVAAAPNPRERPPATGGVNHHRLLQGLLLGDDHPQYTQWAQEETIIESWTWAIGAVEQWNIDASRVAQTIPFVVTREVSDVAARYAGLQVNSHHTALGTRGGIELSLENVTSPADGDMGNQLGLWEGGVNTGTDDVALYPPNAAAGGYRWLHDASQNSEGDLIFYSHNLSAVGTEIYRHWRDATQMGFVDGTAAAPVLTFSADRDTGIYRAGSNQLGFTTAGVVRVAISTSLFTSDVTSRWASGTAAAPAVAFQADINSGLYSISADIMGFSTAGTERFRIGSLGQWGLAGANYGTAGQVLTSNGAALAPTWQDDGGVQSLISGHGIGIDDYADPANPIVFVDESDEFYWTGQHIFTSAVTKIGDAPTETITGANPSLQISGSTAFALMARYDTTASGPNLVIVKSRSATIGGHAILVSGDNLGALSFGGSNGTAFEHNKARIIAFVDGAPGAANDFPTRLSFYTTPEGSSTVAERWRITNAGHWQALADNTQVQLGVGQDLTLYHNGTDSVIANITGELNIQSPARVRVELTSGVDMLNLTAGASVFGSAQAAEEVLAINGMAGFTRDVRFQSTGVNRWLLRTDATAEGGANAGSNFNIISRNDAGAQIAVVLNLTRSTGAATFSGLINAALGATGTPTYSFTGDLNTGMWSPGADIVALSTNAIERFRVANARVSATVPITLQGYTVATLPAGTVGDTAYVTNALLPVFGVAVAGGGAVVIPVFYNGAAWIVG